jgi:protein-S-isoprenylcysteine O-methyltransferase Ste14
MSYIIGVPIANDGFITINVIKGASWALYFFCRKLWLFDGCSFLVITIIFAIIYLIFMPTEERYCLETYGKEYQDYMERTPRWIGLPKSKK